MTTRLSPFLPLVVAAPLAALVLTAPISAPAQPRPDLPLGYVSSNSNIISQQISLALELERRALHLLAGAEVGPESIDPIHSLVYDSYVFVRFAVSGVRQVGSRRRFPNPLLQIEDDLMEQARADLRDCMTELMRIRAGSSQDMALAVDSLTKAMTHLETLKGIMP